jgi:hypothetical protein
MLDDSRWGIERFGKSEKVQVFVERGDVRVYVEHVSETRIRATFVECEKDKEVAVVDKIDGKNVALGVAYKIALGFSKEDVRGFLATYDTYLQKHGKITAEFAMKCDVIYAIEMRSEALLAPAFSGVNEYMSKVWEGVKCIIYKELRKMKYSFNANDRRSARKFLRNV